MCAYCVPGMVLGAQGTMMNKIDTVLNFSKFWAIGVPDSVLVISVDAMQERIEGHGKLA